mmetsp:Transcript_52388/g.138897  ORF Transcript_52388/g.138897 Transcript_52388/m.138897 type:complete len:209 (-) Transcript_52388:155-781(-)
MPVPMVGEQPHLLFPPLPLLLHSIAHSVVRHIVTVIRRRVEGNSYLLVTLDTSTLELTLQMDQIRVVPLALLVHGLLHPSITSLHFRARRDTVLVLPHELHSPLLEVFQARMPEPGLQPIQICKPAWDQRGLVEMTLDALEILLQPVGDARDSVGHQSQLQGKMRANMGGIDLDLHHWIISSPAVAGVRQVSFRRMCHRRRTPQDRGH